MLQLLGSASERAKHVDLLKHFSNNAVQEGEIFLCKGASLEQLAEQTGDSHSSFNDLSAHPGNNAVRTEQDPSPDSSLEWGNENPAESQSQARGQAQSRPRTGQQPVKTGRTEGSAGDAASEDRRGRACRQARIGQTIPRPVERSVANKKFGGLKAAQPLRNRFIRAP